MICDQGRPRSKTRQSLKTRIDAITIKQIWKKGEGVCALNWFKEKEKYINNFKNRKGVHFDIGLRQVLKVSMKTHSKPRTAVLSQGKIGYKLLIPFAKY